MLGGDTGGAALEEARENITPCVWCDHTLSWETARKSEAGNVPKGETAVWKGETFLLVFIFQKFYGRQSDSENSPREECVPGSQLSAQHLSLVYSTKSSPLSHQPEDPDVLPTL